MEEISLWFPQENELKEEIFIISFLNSSLIMTEVAQQEELINM